MDLTSTVRSDSLQGVGSILIPGALTSVPYVALLWGPPHNLKQFVDGNQGASTVAAAVLIVAIGLLAESVGSLVEYHLVDACHKDRAAMLDRWRTYLKIAWKTEPIGQHYLRRILPIFKFELNLSVATMATVPGVIALAYYAVLPMHGAVTIGAGILIGATYLFCAAVISSRLLDELRTSLIEQARLLGDLK